MPQTLTQNRDELSMLENTLRDELWRLFRDVNCWHLECRDYDWKRAYFDTYEFSDDGQLKLTFHVVGGISADEAAFQNLTHEDLSRVRALAKRIFELKSVDNFAIVDRQ